MLSRKPELSESQSPYLQNGIISVNLLGEVICRLDRFTDAKHTTNTWFQGQPLRLAKKMPESQVGPKYIPPLDFFSGPEVLTSLSIYGAVPLAHQEE